MGLFGKSRLRELLLGGVSRALLDRSAIPLLLAHS
jgi:nucleotide-binding universal stress UspA family protein